MGIHLFRILEFNHYDVFGNIKNRYTNLNNILHVDGEKFILEALFTGGQNNTVIPEYYYVGMDNRSELNREDTINDLVGEPVSGGYERQKVKSTGEFTVVFEDNKYVAKSSVVYFESNISKWGPVTNVFLTTSGSNSGAELISSIKLPGEIEVDVGEFISFRFVLGLDACTS